MKFKLIAQEKSAGIEISESLKSKKYSKFWLAVAYVKNSGISRIYNDLVDFSNSGGKTSAIVGIDQNVTSYQALLNLSTFANQDLYIHHDRNFDVAFHPKMYLFGNDEIEKMIIGSSNLTAGGLYRNFEVNVGIDFDKSLGAINLKNQVQDYWENLIEDENTKQSDLNFLKKLLELGLIIDENKQSSFRQIIEQTLENPFKQKKEIRMLPPASAQISIEAPQLRNKFAMTLSGFDVSPKSQDPVILIPLAALKQCPTFWCWPKFYTNSSGGYPQLYATANIKIDGKTIKDQYIRIYYYDAKKEFRLQCEAIKRNGNRGDIINIHKDYDNSLEFGFELLRKDSTKYKTVQSMLVEKASSQKYFLYY